MRRKALTVLVVAGLLTVGAAGTALALGSPDQQATAAPDGQAKSVSVSGQGSANAAPDKAVIRVAVVAEGDDSATVRDDLSAGAADLREALGEAGVSDDQIQTDYYRIREGRPYPREERERPTRGEHAFEVELADTDMTGAVVDAAADSGAEVQNLRFTLAEDTRADLRDEALENAMGDADRQAQTLAGASDLTITGVHSVDATNNRYRPVRYEGAVAETAAGDGGSTSIESGDVSVSVSVRVVYNATG